MFYFLIHILVIYFISFNVGHYQIGLVCLQLWALGLKEVVKKVISDKEVNIINIWYKYNEYNQGSVTKKLWSGLFGGYVMYRYENHNSESNKGIGKYEIRRL